MLASFPASLPIFFATYQIPSRHIFISFTSAFLRFPLASLSHIGYTIGMRLFGKKRPCVPVIPLAGLITSAALPARRGAFHLASLARVLDKAFTMRRAKAVALVINSPGGSPVQSALIANRIRDLARKNDLAVLAFVEDIAASGGYWLACAGDQIIANGASVVGSIGVISSGFGFDKAIAKLGIDRRVYTAGTQKGILDPFRPENKDDIAHLKTMQADIHQQFIDAVKKRRGSKLKQGEVDLFSGAFWTGRRALELGLVDRIGELRPVLQDQFGKNVEIKVMQPKRSLFGIVPGGGAYAEGGDGDAGLGRGGMAAMVEAVLLRLEARFALMRYGL